MKAIVTNTPIGGRLEVSAAAQGQMQRFVQNTFYKREAGGVLLGRHLQDSFDTVIDQVTVPMRGDWRGRHYFHRAQFRHQQAIDLAWQQSSGTVTYLGEWHTHPEMIPTPSSTDLRNWFNRLERDTYSCNILYFMILGRRSWRIWAGQRHDRDFALVAEVSI